MTSPNVTATISAVDNASPVMRELLTNLKKAEQLAKQAFDGNTTGNLARGLNQANVAAEKHLGLLGRMHSAYKMIGATVAGYAGLRMVHGGVDAIKHALPYLREDVAIKARTGYSEADMVTLRKQQNELASTYGATVEATQKAHETFGRLKYDAATNLAITRPTAIGAKAMGVTPEHNAELMESMISQYAIHFDSPADAQAKATRLNDLAAVATKKSNMTFEDVKEFTKYSAAAANAAGVSPEVNLAMGMALRRGGIVGSEAGVFARQLYARELAPTRKGREVLAQNGINIDDYSTHGVITGEGLSDKMARNFGKRLSKEAVAGINSQLEDHGDEILSDRGKFTEMVRKAAETSGEKLTKTDQKNLARAANEYFDFTKQGFKGEALLNRIIESGNPMLMAAFLGDKQGARGIALLQERDKFNEAKGDLGHADGFAKKVADEMNAGLASAVERFSASAEALSNTMVKANESWLTGITNAATSATTALTNLSPEAQKAAGIFAGMATLAGGAGLVASMGRFMFSVNEASAALQVMAGRAAIPGGAIPAAPKGSRLVQGIGTLASLTAGGAVAVGGGQLIYSFTNDEAQGVTRDHTRARRARNAIRADADERMQRDLWASVPVPRSGLFDKYQPASSRLDDVSSRYLRSSDDRGVTSSGWQDSTRNVGQSSGFKDVAVTGNVSGAAELAINVNGEIRPTPYLEGIIHRAEANANISLSGYLGTSMQGPGDNATKASVGAFQSGGHH